MSRGAREHKRTISTSNTYLASIANRWTHEMIRVHTEWKNIPEYKHTFLGNIVLDTCYYSYSSLFSPLRLTGKILPVLDDISQHHKVNFLITNSDRINRQLIEYIDLLKLTNIFLYKTKDIKYIKNLIPIPLDIGYTGINKYFDLQWMRRLRNLITTPSTIKKFTIVRKNLGRNMPTDIFNFLLKEKFFPIILEEYSVQEQINIFAGASQIVATQGAGLANTIYCTPGCKIMELSSGVSEYVFPNYIDFINKQFNFNPKINFHQIGYDKGMIKVNIYTTKQLRHMHHRGIPPYAKFNTFLENYETFFK